MSKHVPYANVWYCFAENGNNIFNENVYYGAINRYLFLKIRFDKTDVCHDPW